MQIFQMYIKCSLPEWQQEEETHVPNLQFDQVDLVLNLLTVLMPDNLLQSTIFELNKTYTIF